MEMNAWWDKWLGPIYLIGVVLLALELNGMAFASDRPVVEFTVVVQEKTIELLSHPKKVVTVWAFGLEG